MTSQEKRCLCTWCCNSLDGFIFPSYLHQVITLEGWVDIMYFVMDAHSFYNFIYFILLIIVSGCRGTWGTSWLLEKAEWNDAEEQGRRGQSGVTQKNRADNTVNIKAEVETSLRKAHGFNTALYCSCILLQT